MKNLIKTIKVENVKQHPLHKMYNKERSSEFMEVSIMETGNKPVNPIVVVPDSKNNGCYLVISGMIRLDALINSDTKEIEVIVCDLKDETEIENYIIELNKHKVLDGYEKLMEFLFFLKKYPKNKGMKGSRYTKIGKATNMGFDRVKDLVILINFFNGDGQIVLERVFGGELTVKEAFQLKKVVETNLEKFNSEESYEKISNPEFDFERLNYGVQNLSIDNDDEFQIMKSFLLKDINLPEFQKTLGQMGRIKEIIQKHDDNKVFVPVLDDFFKTEHTNIIKGDNKEVVLPSRFLNKVGCLVGSSVYGVGEKRPNSLNGDEELLTRMTGEEFGIYLAETYERYKPYLKTGGSIYNIIDDYRLDTGEFSCSLEYFVLEMRKRGMYLVGRYTWEKINPCPRSYEDEDMVNGFEMIYRFVLDPSEFYTNTDIFIEKEVDKKLTLNSGCTNNSKDGSSTRGGQYVQSHLKKLRNTLNEQVGRDIIKGNVSNPEDFFRQEEEHRHTSTSPVYLTSVLILESTQKDDLVLDIWNGVGNTMTSSLLLQREYLGIEKEETYYQQTCRRVIETEEMMKEVDLTHLLTEYKIAS